MARKVKLDKIIKAIGNKTYEVNFCSLVDDPRTNLYCQRNARIQIMAENEVIISFRFDSLSKRRPGWFYTGSVRTYKLNVIELYHASANTRLTEENAEHASEWLELESLVGKLVEEYFDTATSDPLYDSIISNLI